ncbi:unnamed protein product, partial [Tetraodon nigroviridis]
CSVRCGLAAGAALGALVAVLGGILIPVGKTVIRSTVEKEAVLEPGTTAYDNWVSADAPVYRQFWFFHVKNPEEVVKNGTTPVVEERGPYTYRTRYLPKENVTYGNDSTVSFMLPLGAIFEPSLSVGPEDDTVTCLNLVVAGAYTLVPEYLHWVLDLAIKGTNSSLFQRRSVRELLWGYQDPVLTALTGRPDLTGLFVPYNGTADGVYTVYTGKDDISKVGLIHSWRGNRTVNFWQDRYCDMINGTDASSFPPFLDQTKPLFFFSSDICRSVSASFERSRDLRGIRVFRYVLLPETLAAPVDNPDNHCFCRDTQVTRNCTLAGALDISSCQDGSASKPVYISLPHFLHGSAVLQQNVLGLHPSPEHHMTYLDVEPTTGFTLSFAKRIQMNMMYGPSQRITVLKKVKDFTIFPILWLNETAELDQETADMFQQQLFSRVRLLEAVQYSLLGVGLAAFFLCLV